jgi:hypothetical protein
MRNSILVLTNTLNPAGGSLSLGLTPILQGPPGQQGPAGPGVAPSVAFASFCLSIAGNPLSNTNYWYLPIAEPVNIPAGWTGSIASCRVAGLLADTVLTVSYIRAGVVTVIGTVTFLAGSIVPVLSGPLSAINLLPNDILCGAIGLVDGALLDMGFTMVALKQ